MREGTVQRWLLRLDRFGQSVFLLDEAVEQDLAKGLNDLEKAGLIQRFEIAWEMGWKTLADYIIETEVPDLAFTPGSAIRTAAQLGLIDDHDPWMSAGKLRNALSHEYSVDRRDEGMLLIRSRYLPMMKALNERMTVRADHA